jgi:hypothetical protein
MEKNNVKIFSATQPYQSSIAKAILEEEGIQCFEIDKRDSSYTFGEIELYVTEEEADKALLILTQNDLL